MRARIEIAVLVLVIAILAATIVPAIMRTRERERAIQAMNNLRNVVVNLQLFYASKNAYPPGAIVDEAGTAYHGWFTQLMPYLDGRGLYTKIDLDVPWDHPVNRRIFSQEYETAIDPSVNVRFTQEEYALLHFMANPAVLYKNSATRVDDIPGGISNTWFLGEIAGGYQPWGYPYNWRDWDGMLNQSPTGFGRPSGDGAAFGMVDGSVRIISSAVAPDVYRKSSESLALPPREATARSNRVFTCQRSGGSERVIHLDQTLGDEKDEMVLIIYTDLNVRDDTAYLPKQRKPFRLREQKTDDLRAVITHSPTVHVVLTALHVDDAACQILIQLLNLEYLRISTVEPTPEVIGQLKELPNLKEIVVTGTDEMGIEQLRELLSGSKIVVRGWETTWPKLLERQIPNRRKK